MILTIKIITKINNMDINDQSMNIVTTHLRALLQNKMGIIETGNYMVACNNMINKEITTTSMVVK